MVKKYMSPTPKDTVVFESKIYKCVKHDIYYGCNNPQSFIDCLYRSLTLYETNNYLKVVIVKFETLNELDIIIKYENEQDRDVIDSILISVLDSTLNNCQDLIGVSASGLFK